MNSEPVGIGDSERCIEIPWALSKYSGEQTVLDIGYANAEERYIKALLSLKIPHLHGLDICEKSIDGIISHIGDIRNTNFNDNFFDLVFCISTIEHIGRDNSVYQAGSYENLDNGDFESLNEIYRITKSNGKVLLTVPFGKFFNYGWFIHYDENRLNKLLGSCPFDIVVMDFFRYEKGWHKCNKSDLANTLYNDNSAPAAAGLVCVLLEKKSKEPLSIQKETANDLDRTMNDNTIEIRDDEINVEEVMAKIHENIRRRQAAGELPPNPDTLIATPPCASTGLKVEGSLQHDLSYITSNWDIHNNSYFISSHHPYLGKMLVKGRQLVHGEVRRYVDPMISRQTDFNASTVRILTQTSQICSELDLKISRQGGELTQKISQQEQEFNTNIQNCVDSNLREVFSHVDKDLRLRMGLVHILEERMQKGFAEKITVSKLTTPTNYLLFEERFRGSREVIKQRQLAFIPYFENCSRVLDIGCGRGEFLEILKDHNISGTGVDLDTDMVAYCRSRHLDVEQSDAIAYLEKLEDESLDGIFIDQVVEHLEPEYLIRLLALCYRKLKLGYYLVVETVNPLSFVSFVNFYIDMTHKRPVHPETLQFIISAAGFRECEMKFSSPVPDSGRLKKITNISELDEAARKNAEIYNHNIEMLNTILFGAQDYAVIGKK